jgi:hypothetical protein
MEIHRCYRLKKECTPSVSIRKKNGRRVLNTRTAQLEEKLDDLVTLLRNQASSGSGPNQQAAAAVLAANKLSAAGVKASGGINTPSTSTSSHTQSPNNAGDDKSAAAQDDTVVADADANSSSACPSCGCPKPGTMAFTMGMTTCKCDASAPSQVKWYQIMPGDMSEKPSYISHPLEPNPVEAEEALATFKEDMLYYLPLVHIPDGMTAKELRERSPFLWFNIMVVTARPLQRLGQLGAASKKFMSEKIVLEHEKSFDLLQGLLIFLGWYEEFPRGS